MDDEGGTLLALEYVLLDPRTGDRRSSSFFPSAVLPCDVVPTPLDPLFGLLYRPPSDSAIAALPLILNNLI